MRQLTGRRHGPTVGCTESAEHKRGREHEHWCVWECGCGRGKAGVGSRQETARDARSQRQLPSGCGGRDGDCGRGMSERGRHRCSLR